MKVITYTSYGGPEVLQLVDRPIPEPGIGQVRIRVKAASANPYEFHFMRGTPLFMRLLIGLRKPKATQLGRDVSGIVDAIGSGATFAVGDEVFGSADGSYAEYVLAKCTEIILKPSTYSFEEAAALPMVGYTGLQGLQAAGVGAGMRVLINGASGGIGHLAVQMAKSLGAHVTATCKTNNLAWVQSLGADEVIDYTKSSYLDRKFDVIIDTVSNFSRKQNLHALAADGKYVWLGAAEMGHVLGPLPQMITGSFNKQVLDVNAKCNPDALRQIINMGLKPTIEHVFALSEAGAAIAHVEAGHTKGKTVIVP